MSEIMLGVLNMPEKLFWSDEPITRFQHDAIRLEAAKEIVSLREEKEQLQTKLAESEARVGKLHGDILHINEYWNGDFNERAMLDALNHITDYTADIIDENIEQLRQQSTNDGSDGDE